MQTLSMQTKTSPEVACEEKIIKEVMPTSEALTIKIIYQSEKIVNHRLTMLVYICKRYLSIAEKPPIKAALFIHEIFGKIDQHR